MIKDRILLYFLLLHRASDLTGYSRVTISSSGNVDTSCSTGAQGALVRCGRFPGDETWLAYPNEDFENASRMDCKMCPPDIAGSL